MTSRFALLAAILLAFSTPLYASGDDHSDHDHGEEHAEHDDHDHDDHGDKDDDEHVSEVGDLRVIHGWAPAVAAGDAQVFFDIEVGETAVTLTAPESEIADHAHVAGAPIKAGGAPVDLGSFPLDAGQEFILGPETVYIALEGLKQPLVEGEEFEIEVTFEPLGTVHINVEVTAEGSTQHPHAGHNH